MKKIQTTIESYIPTTLSQSEKGTISRAAAVCAAEDLLPFTFIEGNGMKKLVNAIAGICHSKKGKLSADDLLCTSMTLKNHVMKIGEEMRLNLKEDLNYVDVDTSKGDRCPIDCIFIDA